MGNRPSDGIDFYRSIFRRLPQLRTDRLILRRLRRRDAQALFDYAKDREVSDRVLWEAHRSLGDSRAFIRAARRQYRKGLPSVFGIELKETGALIGTIGFAWLNGDNETAEIGYSLSRAYWNQGLMTEALEAVLRFAFTELHLNRVEAQHELTNPASGRVMDKVGMKEEGILRESLYIKGRKSDMRLCAMLRADWESAHPAPTDTEKQD